MLTLPRGREYHASLNALILMVSHFLLISALTDRALALWLYAVCVQILPWTCEVLQLRPHLCHGKPSSPREMDDGILLIHVVDTL